MDTYPASANNLGSKKVNSTQTLGQKIQFAATHWVDGSSSDNNHEQITDSGARVPNPNNVEGPLVMVRLHLEKATQLETQIEVSVRAGGLEADSTSYLMAKEVVRVSQISQGRNDYEYEVHFQQPAYLLPGQAYYLQLKHVSGAEDVEWKYVAGSDGYVGTAVNQGYQFKLKGYACDGCRTKMAFDPTTDARDDLQFGLYNNLTEDGGSTFTTIYDTQAQEFRDSSTPRSFLTQEFRPSETSTLNKIYLRLKTNTITRVDGSGGNPVTTGDQAYVSIWITKYGKYGEAVCKSIKGSHVANICDTNGDGIFTDTCAVGATCDIDSTAAVNGGCGDAGECSLATTFAATFRPDDGLASVGPCGDAISCANTQTLQPDTQKTLKNQDGWVQFEFNTPIPVEKHTTYYVNVGVIGNIDVSKPVTWYSGAAWGDGGSTADNGGNARPTGAPAAIEIPSNDLRSAYRRDAETHVWTRVVDRVMAIKFTRCVSSTAQTLGFVTTGERTGCCSARSSPQGGLKGSTVTVTGRNFFPSEHLSCIFRNPDGTTAATQPATSVDYSYTVATCEAPSLNPYSATDCSDPTNCLGVDLVMTNDAFTTGPQYLAPKWHHDQSWNNAQLGYQTMKYLFSDIFVSTSGSDTTGDGTQARPYATIQRGLDAANEYDQIILFCGTYTGTGNRGLRHHGKKIQLRSIDTVDVMATNAADSRTLLMAGQAESRVMNEGSDVCGIDTVLDCEHSSDGFILNNNKDSDSPFAGHIDTEGIIVRNCESLRIYDV
jgi:hypothetical protein